MSRGACRFAGLNGKCRGLGENGSSTLALHRFVEVCAADWQGFVLILKALFDLIVQSRRRWSSGVSGFGRRVNCSVAKYVQQFE